MIAEWNDDKRQVEIDTTTGEITFTCLDENKTGFVSFDRDELAKIITYYKTVVQPKNSADIVFKALII